MPLETPLGLSLYTYFDLFKISCTTLVYLQVPESIIFGYNFTGICHMHNKEDGSLCFEEIYDHNKLKTVIES